MQEDSLWLQGRKIIFTEDRSQKAQAIKEKNCDILEFIEIKIIYSLKST